MSLIGAPLPSATYAGYDSAYYAARDAGGNLVGVESLNSLIGSLAIAGDSSIGVTKPGLGVIQVSTAGLPQVPSSVTTTGPIVGATVTATGTLAGAGAAIAGGMTVGSITAAGPVNSTSIGGSYVSAVVPATATSTGTMVIGGYRHTWGRAPITFVGALGVCNVTFPIPFSGTPFLPGLNIDYGTLQPYILPPATTINPALANAANLSISYVPVVGQTGSGTVDYYLIGPA